MSYDFSTDLSKKCSRCGREKAFEDFYRRKDTPDGHGYTCKACQKAYLEEYRLTYDQTAVHDQCRKRNMVFLRSAKSKPCFDCGLIFESFCMDWDHVSGVKIGNVSEMAHQLVSLETLQNEISKCDLVCVLCHRDRTHLRNTSRITRSGHTISNRQVVLDAKSRPCEICGNKYDYWKMDFDHVSGLKLFRISQFMNGQRNYTKRLREEIAKCQLLCALCHRRKTASERGINVI